MKKRFSTVWVFNLRKSLIGKSSQLFKILTRTRTYRSVVLFTNSPFQSPQVSSLAVAAKKMRLTASSTPIGPKKYANISMSPASRKQTPLKIQVAIFRSCGLIIKRHQAQYNQKFLPRFDVKIEGRSSMKLRNAEVIRGNK